MSWFRRGQIRRVRGKGAFVATESDLTCFERTGGFRESVLCFGRRRRPSVFSRVPSVMRGHITPTCLASPRTTCSTPCAASTASTVSPVSIETALIPCLLFPAIEGVDVSVFSLYETYEMLGRKPDQSAQEKLDIEALGARDAGLLGLEQGDLVLLLECVSYDASGQAIEYVKSFNRGDTGGYTYTY